MVVHEGQHVGGRTVPVRSRGVSRLVLLRGFAILALLFAFLIEVLARYLSQLDSVSGAAHKSISLFALIILSSSGLYLVFSLRDIAVVKWSMVFASFLLLLSQVLNIAREFALVHTWPIVGNSSLLGGATQGLILIGGLILMLATLYFALVEMVVIQKRLLQERRELSLEVAERKRTEAALSASRAQIRRLSAHLESAREEERARIAREIHDELGQTVTGLCMNLGHLEHEIKRDNLADRKGEMLDEVCSMRDLVGQTIKSVRRIITELRPGVLDDLGLQAAVEWQAQEFQRRSGIPCDLDLSVEGIELDRDKSTALFRIFQEALTNVARHAHASRIAVRMHIDDGVIGLEVSDDGRGIENVEEAEHRSFGLMGIRERVLQFQGRFVVESAPGEGTRIVVTLPLAVAAPAGPDGEIHAEMG